MAVTFLDLTNDVLKRLNEVLLTSATFDTASNIHQDAKNAVNAALNKIHRDQFEWPFQHKKETLVCIPGQNTYQIPVTAKTVAFDTFRLRKDRSYNYTAAKLVNIDYEEFLERVPDFEDEVEEDWGKPEVIVRNRDLTFTVYPTPREPYEITFEYYEYPDVLSSWDSEMSLPDFFRWVIHEGAMYHMYTFRGALEEAQACNALFEDGIKDMRILFINRYEYVRSSMIRR